MFFFLFFAYMAMVAWVFLKFTLWIGAAIILVVLVVAGYLVTAAMGAALPGITVRESTAGVTRLVDEIVAEIDRHHNPVFLTALDDDPSPDYDGDGHGPSIGPHRHSTWL